MSQSKPSDFPLLLEVFRYGLAIGLISKSEIVEWADSVIKNELEPDYFFIEISLSKNTNEAVEILNNYISESESPIPVRVSLGVIYYKLTNADDPMTIEEAVGLMGNTPFYRTLNPYETNCIYTFDDYQLYYGPDHVQLEIEVLNFLSVYKDFNLSNYYEWFEINEQVEETLKEEQTKLDIRNKAINKAWKRGRWKRKLKQHYKIGIVALVVIAVMITNFIMMPADTTLSKFFLDHEYIFYLDIYISFFVVRLIYVLWKRARRRR